MPVYKPVTKQGINTFEKIVETAKVLFSETGYKSTSINKIIEEAKIATGTFYIYFKDKISLYEYILNNYQTKIRNHINDAVARVDSRYEKEREGLKAFIMFAAQDRLAYNIIWESLFVEKKLFVDYYESFSEKYVKGLARSLKNDEIRDVDLETLSYILMGIANFVGLQIMFKRKNDSDPIDEKSIDAIVDSVMDILANGMFKKK